MKRLTTLLLILLALTGLALAEEPQGMLMLVTGAFFDSEGGVKVTAKPARVELPEGARENEYILVEEPQEVFALRPDAYLAVPAELPIYGVRLLQASAEDFPIYLNEMLNKMDTVDFSGEPPAKGDGIAYRDYSLLYRAALLEGQIASLTFCELPEGFAP